MQLPAELRAKLEELIGGGRKDLSQNAAQVSLKYRRALDNPDLQIASMDEARAYAATRLPATWCAVSDVLSHLMETMPDFSPVNILDLGAGPGTASLAAENIWPSITSTLIEPNTHLRSLGQSLISGNWIPSSLQAYDFKNQADLVVASYVLNEINGNLAPLLEKIWSATHNALILIEPGTPHGYQTILKARDYFRARNANIAAPCPHEMECPLKDTDRWCHFSVRVERSRLQLQVKPDARLPYEDEKYSYLVITRQPTAKPFFRALGEPHGQKVITLETCRDDGTFGILSVSKRDDLYKIVKKARWGDSV